MVYYVCWYRGYFLSYLFKSDSASVVLLMLLIMVFFFSWIALSNVPASRISLLKSALIATAVVGALTLFVVTPGRIKHKRLFR
jgi:putative ABC transport system permease protein